VKDEIKKKISIKKFIKVKILAISRMRIKYGKNFFKEGEIVKKKIHFQKSPQLKQISIKIIKTKSYR
jgi:hypothetical protein